MSYECFTVSYSYIGHYDGNVYVDINKIDNAAGYFAEQMNLQGIF